MKKNLERIVKMRDRMALRTKITFNFLVFSFNEHEIPAAQRYCDDLGIAFNTRNAFIHNPEWLPSYRKEENPLPVPDAVALPESFGHTSQGQRVAWSPLPPADLSQGPPRCAWHYGYAAMTAGGNVAPCCAVPRQENDFGKVVPGEERFGDVWNNDRYMRSRADFADSPIEAPETVCTRCPVPKFVHHMYSLHDFKVIGQFARVWKDSDPVLKEAFELLSRARYGLSVDQLFPGGDFRPPEHLFGTESLDQEHTERFLRFVAEHLDDAAPAAPFRGRDVLSAKTS